MNQLTLFDPQPASTRFDLADVFEAYYRCRRSKRYTMNALAFEVDFEAHLVALWRELNDGSYRPRRSVAFVIDKPVKREIFAADFRDRVVHHLIVDKLNPLFEVEFIHDSYASRVGRGTLFGVRRLDRFIRQCSRNYTRDAYVLRLDILGFFMHINIEILFRRLKAFIELRYHQPDQEAVIKLCRVVLLNDVIGTAVIKGRRSDWGDLPAAKSMFGTPPGCGLPIGNLTSQVFANFYLNDFDHYVKHDWGVRWYGRYVDDLVLVHQDRDHLRRLIPMLRRYLGDELGLRLHPNKIQLQHCGKGARFLGAVIKPGRVYAGKRIKTNFRAAITRHNAVVADREPDQAEREAFRAAMNSYLGLLAPCDTRRLRRAAMAYHVNADWWAYAHVHGAIDKVVLKQS